MDKTSERIVSKAILNEYRAVVKARRQARITKILSKFKGLRHIAGIKANDKRKYIVSMVDNKGFSKEE